MSVILCGRSSAVAGRHSRERFEPAEFDEHCERLGAQFGRLQSRPLLAVDVPNRERAFQFAFTNFPTDKPFDFVKTTGDFTVSFRADGKYKIPVDVEKSLYAKLPAKPRE